MIPSWEDMIKLLLIPERYPMPDTTNVQFGDPISFIVIIYRSISERLHIGVEMT